MRGTEKMKCKICRKTFLKNTTAKKRLPFGIRGKNTVTCSIECSRKLKTERI